MFHPAHEVAKSLFQQVCTLGHAQVPVMWGDLNVNYVAADNAAEMGCMKCYLDKPEGKAPNRDDLMDYQPLASR